MTQILLTGAGFTHNWGAWLGKEAFEYLLGCRELHATIRDELWVDKNNGLGFEATLDRLQQRAKSDTTGQAMLQVRALSNALLGMFRMMDYGLRERQFEFQNDRKYHLAALLYRFDAIFTLNQDIHLERGYFPHVPLSQTKFGAARSPGIAPTGATQARVGDPMSSLFAPLPESQFGVHPQCQPYFKLHGSFDWRTSDGGELLVMGGNKDSAIKANPLLAWYGQQFTKYLTEGGTKLMVIGYSFGDPHINAALVAAVATGLKLFIIDPLGTDVLDKRPPNQQIRAVRDALMEALQPAIIGASRRPLSSTFGGDIVEHRRVMGFFDA